MALSFEIYDLHLTQLKYIKLAASTITTPAYKPDQKTVVQIGTLETAAEEALGMLVLKYGELNTARGNLEDTHGEARASAVAAYACMKSCYRSSKGTVGAIKRLPKSGSSPKKTWNRMDAIAKQWGQLPNVPGTSGPMVVGDTTQEAFEDLRDDLDDKMDTFKACDTAFKSQHGKFKEMDADISGFITAALTQGRTLYAEGTANRAVIDGIPTQPSAQAPGQAQITTVESPAAGEGHLLFGAPHATSFRVRHKGPGEPAFVDVATVLLPGEFTATGLAGGVHEYQIVPHNSRGDGPASEVVSIEVIAVGAPAAPAVSPPESLAPGEVHFQFTAEGATGFEVWEKGPGASVYALAVTVPASGTGEGEYSASGQPQGVHWYKVRAINPEGPGPFSAPVSLDVMEAAA